jgi:hypothetical protein
MCAGSHMGMWRFARQFKILNISNGASAVILKMVDGAEQSSAQVRHIAKWR